MSRDMEGRVALVTGGASGIGEAVCHRFAERGASVAIVDRDAEGAQRVLADLEDAGATATSFVGDLTDPATATAAVEHAVATLGGLHMAVNNAGISGVMAPTHEYPVDVWRDVMSVNLDAVFFCVRAELQHMTKNGEGAIVNTGSMFSVAARTDLAAYVSAKHAVAGLTKAAALDSVQFGVRVNSVAPAVVETPILASVLNAEEIEALANLNPSRRLCTPREVANVTTFLCSDEASFVNGAVYTVDGAYTAR